MKNRFFLFLVALLAGVQGVFAQVTNVDAAQVDKNILITYDLDRTSDISVECSTDGGRTYKPLYRVSGAVGKSVQAGNNTITWDVLAEQDNLIGDKICFRVNATTGRGTANGHEWVDLGLSVKWATCNVGATKPEKYGNYYAWGETETKSLYLSGNYSYSAKPDVLPLDRDAAAVNWGGTWRMPTDAEWTELRTSCTWTWTTRKGVKGYTVKSNINGNSIFLPAAGDRHDDGLYFAGYYGYYWSSSLYADSPNYAWSVIFNSDLVGRGSSSRFFGQSVRPVLGE